jgi:hypothetical protein
VRYYPASYLLEKVLLRSSYTPQIIKNYKKYIEKFSIDYGYNTGGIQDVYCISEEGLRLILHNGKVGRLSIEQRKAMNGLLEFFTY